MTTQPIMYLNCFVIELNQNGIFVKRKIFISSAKSNFLELGKCNIIYINMYIINNKGDKWNPWRTHDGITN